MLFLDGGRARLHERGVHAGPQLAVALRGLGDLIAVGGDTGQETMGDRAALGGLDAAESDVTGGVARPVCLAGARAIAVAVGGRAQV